MGWVESLPAFCAGTKTIADLANNASLATNMQSLDVPHQLNVLLETATTSTRVTEKRSKQMSIPGLSDPAFLQSKNQVLDARTDLAPHVVKSSPKTGSFGIEIDLDLSSTTKTVLVLPAGSFGAKPDLDFSSTTTSFSPSDRVVWREDRLRLFLPHKDRLGLQKIKLQQESQNNYFLLLSNDEPLSAAAASPKIPSSLSSSLSLSLSPSSSSSSSSPSPSPCAPVPTTSAHRKLQRPIQYWDVYVDDFWVLFKATSTVDVASNGPS